MGKYSDIDFKPPESVQKEFKQALDIDPKLQGDGLESSTVAMAKKIASGQAISPEQARKGYRFWSRNDRFLDADKDSAAWVSAKFWGGRSGKAWYSKLYKQIEAADKANNVATNIIKQESGKWYVYSEQGKKLSKGYDSREQAEDRLDEIEAFKHMKKARVNILNAVNASKIKIERNGDLAIIKNYRWHIDDVVLNEGLYPADENKKAYESMNGRIAPAGHPKAGDKYVAISNLDNEDATDALREYYIGASVKNVRNQSGEYYCDIEVDTKFAEATESGKEVNKWIEQAESYIAGNGEAPKPLHTSTGLMVERVQRNGESRGKKYSWVAANQRYDHLALLPGDIGAGGEELSLSVNTDGEDCMVINCDMTTEEYNQNEPEDTLFSKVWNKLLHKLQLTPETDSVHNIEVDPMEEMLINALSEGGVKTEGLSDEQLLAAYNEMMSKKSKDKEDETEENGYDGKKKKKAEENMTDEEDDEKKAMNARIEALEKALAANADAELKPLREEAKQVSGLSETAINAMSKEDLQKLVSNNRQPAPLFAGNASKSEDSAFGSDYNFGE